MATLEHLLSPALVERLGWTLIHFVWQAAAVALLLAVLLKALHRRSAQARYLMACLALMLIVALPLVTMALVEVSEPVAEAGPAPIPTPVQETTPVEVIEVVELSEMSFDTLPLEVPDVSVPWTQRAVTALEPALPYLVLGWLLGVFGLSAWHLGGWAQLQRMKRRMVLEVAAPLHAKLRELAAALGIRRAVALLESALVEVPTVVGWVKPVILLPASALSGLSAEQLEAILAHELAHIRRYDYLVNIAQTVVEILGFYHPALWWISHKIRAERENCCDDLAVQVCGDSVRYARALTCLEEMRHHRSELAVAASGGSLVARIGRLLGRPAIDERRFTWLPGLIALLLVAAAIIPTALVLAAPNRRQPKPFAPQNAEETTREPTRILLDVRTVFVYDDKPLGSDMAASLRGTLGTNAARTSSNTWDNITAHEFFRTRLASQILPIKTVLTLNDTLHQGGYLREISNPQHLTQAGRQTHISLAYDRAPLVTTPLTPFEIRMKELCAGLALDVTPNVSDNDEVLLKINVERTDSEHAGGEDVSRGAAAKTIDHLVAMRDGESFAFHIAPTVPPQLPGSLYVIVTTWIHRVEAEVAQATASTNNDGQPSKPIMESKTLSHAVAEGQDETAIRIDCMFAEVQIDQTLDRATVQRIGDVLADEDPQDRDELARLAAQEDVTLGEVLRKWVARQSLTRATMEALIDLLKAGGYAMIEAAPSIQTRNNVPAEVKISQKMPILAPGEPASSAQYIDLGYTVQATPHFSPQADDRITLEIAAQCTEPIGDVRAGELPTVSTTEVASTVTVRRDRFFSLLLEPDEAGGTRGTDRTARLIMFRADCVTPPAQPGNASIPPVQQDASQPRQILLDVQVVAMEGGNFKDLGIEWASPQVRTGSFAPGGASNAPWGVELGYTPDKAFTNALNAALHRLRNQGRAQLLSNPQVAALDGHQARVTIQTEEWFSLQPEATTDDPAPQAELVPVTAGTVLTATPRLGDNNEITLEIAIDVSGRPSLAQHQGLPVVTRRTARNVVTVQDGGTVALAGLSADGADAQKQVAILVTAALAPEDSPVAQPENASVTLPPASRIDEEVLRAREADLEARIAAALKKPQPDYRDIALDRELLKTLRRRIEMILARRKYVNSDPMVQELAKGIGAMERELITARQTLAAEHPTVVQKEDLLERFKSTLAERRQELEREFDAGLDERLEERRQQLAQESRRSLSADGQSRFLHTDSSGKIDREFGFEELIHSEQNRWTVTNPYMDLFGNNARCSIAAERGQIQLERGPDQPTPGDVTFSGNVVVDMTPVERDGAETCVLHADTLTYDTEKNRLSCSGPARFVCGGTEYVGRGLELYGGPAPTRPAGDRIKTIKGVDLYMTPSSSLIVTLDGHQTAPEAAQVRVQERESAPSSQNTDFHIRLDFTVMKVAADARLDPETAAQASRWLSAADSNETAANAWPPSELRKHTVDQLLETLQRDVPAESFGTFVDLLTSRRYATVLLNPTLVVAEGQQAEIAVSDEVKLAVVAEAESNGHGVRMATRLDLTVRDPLPQPNDPGAGPESAPVTFQTRGSLAILWANNRGYALRRLPNTAAAATAKATTDVYYLLVRPVLVLPLKASKAIASTPFERDLLKILGEIATGTGKRIQVDETVKPQPVAGDLETVGFVEVILPRVLEDTPYTYRKLGDDAYLVYRPITATFRGDDLPQAIQDIALKAGVTIVSDPNVSGELYADLQDVPLETALRTILGGSPFVVEKKADYYLVRDRAAPSAGEDTPTTPGHARVSATFMGEDLRRVLEKLAEEAGANLMYDANISGEVYAELRDVPLEQALNIVLAGGPCVVKKIPNGYAITTREKPPAPPSEQAKDAVQVTARFVLVDDALMEALHDRLPIRGVPYPEDANALYEIGDAVAAGETPLLEQAQVGLLLKAIRSYTDSQALAAPRVTVPDGEAATLSLTEKLDYVGGYGEPNYATSEPIQQHKSKNLGITFDVTPHLLKNQGSFRLQVQAEITSLVEMHKALYQSKYEYEVPSFETVTIQTELVVPDGQMALVHGQKLRSLNGTQPGQDEPERSLFILITSTKSSATPSGAVPPMMGNTRPGAPGMGGSAPTMRKEQGSDLGDTGALKP